MTALDEAARALKEARRIVVFSGAGVSAESGIDTFRTEGGFWQRYSPEEFGTPMGLAKLYATDPARLARFLEELVGPIACAAPNPGHQALFELERGVAGRGGALSVITQNVDELHQAAGSSRVHEIHGSLFHIVDAEGRALRRLERPELARIADALARAQRGPFKRSRIARAMLPLIGLPRAGDLTQPRHRPSVVMFGEALAEPAWQRAQDEARRADAVLVVGTSGLVYPAATIPEIAAEAGARVVEVGPERAFEGIWLPGQAGVVLPELVSRVQHLSGGALNP
ncbi:MAG: iron dicitrate transport regulator FecR [Deltaproteobacteria bacterium]|nr:iron dicitrate transport regulator FecR [Deltaproteobacteria bacterium]